MHMHLVGQRERSQTRMKRCHDFALSTRWAAWSLCLALIVAGCTGSRESSEDERSGDWEPRVTRVYHVQIRMTERKTVADRTVGAVMSWWREQPAAERPSAVAGIDELPVRIVWRPPLYRVRVGPFTTRDRAQTMLDVLEGPYPDAFIAPERMQAEPARLRR